MKYYVGDTVVEVYRNVWEDSEYLIVITRVTKSYYEGYNKNNPGKKRAYLIKNAHETLKLHKRGLADVLKKL